MKKTFVTLGILLNLLCLKAYAEINVAVISDTVMTRTTPYNAYYKTPDFLVQDVVDLLSRDRNLNVIPYSKVRKAIERKKLHSNDIAYLWTITNGYDINFHFLQVIGKHLGVSKFIIVTSSIETQRDFLKSTLWSSIGIGGWDTINPTHRVTIYSALVDINSESVLWEGLYAKNIRNNKMKNLNTTISGNYEGLMRIKRYSKFISPEISKGVRIALGTMGAGEQYQSNVKGIIKATNKKMQIGSSKNLNNPNGTMDAIEGYKKDHDLRAQKKREERAIKKERREFLKEQKREERAIEKERKERIKERKKAEQLRLKTYKKL